MLIIPPVLPIILLITILPVVLISSGLIRGAAFVSGILLTSLPAVIICRFGFGIVPASLTAFGTRSISFGTVSAILARILLPCGGHC
jgi:hypothetical protein